MDGVVSGFAYVAIMVTLPSALGFVIKVVQAIFSKTTRGEFADDPKFHLRWALVAGFSILGASAMASMIVFTVWPVSR